MKHLYGKKMNYNIMVIISLILSATISLFISYYVTIFLLAEESAFFKMVQLIFAIASMTTFYASIKYMLMKYMNIEEERKEND